jgi:hypothetical protein
MSKCSCKRKRQASLVFPTTRKQHKKRLRRYENKRLANMYMCLYTGMYGPIVCTYACTYAIWPNCKLDKDLRAKANLAGINLSFKEKNCLNCFKSFYIYVHVGSSCISGIRNGVSQQNFVKCLLRM